MSFADTIDRMKKGHQVRVTYEQLALFVLLLVVIVACFIGFYSKDMADRVVKLADSIKGFLEVLSGTTAVTMLRGHMDNRLGANTKGAPDAGS